MPDTLPRWEIKMLEEKVLYRFSGKMLISDAPELQGSCQSRPVSHFIHLCPTPLVPRILIVYHVLGQVCYTLLLCALFHSYGVVQMTRGDM